MSVDDVGVTIRFGEAIDLVASLIAEQGTHLHAAVRGWDYPMSRLERDMRLLTQRVHNALRGKDDPPIDLGWPWSSQPLVSEEERDALMEQLKRRSAFRD